MFEFCDKTCVILLLATFVQVCKCRDEHKSLMTTNWSRIAYEMCPKNNFCEKIVHNGTQNDGKGSCCAPCSCDKYCYIGQTCCPDAETDIAERVPLSCKHQDEHFNLHRNVYLMLPESYPRFYVIETCKADFQDIDVIAGCHNPQEIRDHVYVTDPDTTWIYKNEKCALCNGIADYSSWKLRIVCPYSDDLYRTDRQYSYILQACSFASEPPLELKRLVSTWMCYSDMLYTCNVTGQWERYDPVLEEGCTTFNTPFIGEISLVSGMRPTRRLFQNVYCYLCNTKVLPHVLSECLALRPLGNSREGLGTSMTAILNFMDVESLKKIKDGVKDGNATCKLGEIEDPLTKRCVVIMCPFGQVYVNDRCISNTEHINVTLSATFSFNYTLSKITQLTPKNVDALYGAIFNRIKDVFALRSCLYCNLGIFSNRVLHIQALPSPKCETKDLLRLFQNFPKVFQKNAGDTFPEIRMRITSEFKEYRAFGHMVREFHTRGVSAVRTAVDHRCVQGAVLMPKFFCKRISYSKTELKARGVNNEMITQLGAYSEPYVYVDGVKMSHVICFHDYMQIVNGGGRLSVTVSLISTALHIMLRISQNVNDI